MASGASKKKKTKGTQKPPRFKKTSPTKMRGKSERASFRLYERKEFVRDLEVPGMAYHVLRTFEIIFKNYRIFLPLVLIMTIATILLVGLSDQYLDGEMVIFGGLIFLTIWLVTIFVLRHKMAGNKIGLRDALYNSMSPFLSSLVVLVVVALQTLPIMILVVAYSAAIETHFLSEPFYAFLFLTFAGLMLLISGYFLSSSLMALVAVSAPGLYPTEALKTTSELMRGRRMKFVLRLALLIIIVVVMWTIIMYPISALTSLLTQYEWTKYFSLVKIAGTFVACFLSIYISAYLYIYYRWMLKFDTKKENRHMS